MMLLLPLTLILAAAPIPKSAGYEGFIGVMIRGPQPEMLVLSPTGNEVRRVPLKDLTGTPYTIKMARGGESAVVTTMGGQPIMVGNRGYSASSGYLISFKDATKPKELFDRKANVKWVLNRDATKIYGTEIDLEKAANAKPGESAPTKAWSLDLKTMKYDPVAIPSGHMLIDISHDDETVLSQSYADGKYRATTFSTKTWKPSYTSESSDYPHGLAPDGRKIFLQEYGQQTGTTTLRLLVHDIATSDRRAIPQPEECQAISAYSYGADNKRIAFAGYSQEINANGRNAVTYRIYTCHTDGTNRKMIYETKPGETISDIDWR